MLNLSRHKVITHEPTGISLKIERLKRDEARPLARALIRVFEELEKLKPGQELTALQKAAIRVEVFSQVSQEDLDRWFTNHVSDVKNVEMDGKAITTGTELLPVIDDDTLLWVLVNLSVLSRLSPSEGNGSASRLPSPRPMQEPSTDSPALSTEREASTGPSDAMATTEAAPSSSPVEA